MTWINLLEVIFPIGSIWQSVNGISPASFMGGTWEKVEGRFLLSSSSAYALNSIGGEINHTLTPNELAKHIHGLRCALTSGSPFAGVDFAHGTGADGWGFINDIEISDSSSQQMLLPKSIPHNNMPPYLVVNIWKRVS